MNRLLTFSVLAFVSLALGGLSRLPAADESGAPKKDPDAKIKAALAKLPDSQRKMAEAQRFCATKPENRLGSMGTPAKVEVGGKVVFLCCAGCKHEALTDPKATLASAEKLKKITAALGKLAEKDRTLAEQQRFCAVMGESRLGSMGTPVKIEIKGQTVFLCCDGCRETALEDPSATLKKADRLRRSNNGDNK